MQGQDEPSSDAHSARVPVGATADPRPTDLPRASTFQRRAAAVCLIAFPLTHFGAALILAMVAAGGDDPASLLATAERSAGALLTSKLLLLVSTALFIPAVFGALRLLTRRGAVVGHVGAGFAVLGALGHMGLVVHTLVLLELPAGERGEMLALLTRVNEGPAFMTIFPLLMSFALGILLLAIGLRRADVLPTWGLALVVLAFLGASVPAPWMEAVQNGLVTAAYGWVGIQVLRMTDRQWATP